MSADPDTINLNDAREWFCWLEQTQYLADFVREDERRLVRDAQFSSHMEGGMAVRSVHEDRDSREDVAQRHLSIVENRAGREGELLVAPLTFENAAAFVFPDAEASAVIAEWFSGIFRKPDGLECSPGLVIRHAGDLQNAQGPRSGRKKIVLDQSIIRVKASIMMLLHALMEIVNAKSSNMMRSHSI